MTQQFALTDILEREGALSALNSPSITLVRPYTKTDDSTTYITAQLTVQTGKITGTLVDFPVLITEDNLPSEMFDADGSIPAKADGGDLRFYLDEAGTIRLATDIVTFVTDNDPANSKALIYVKHPSAASLATLYCKWGNASHVLPAPDAPYGRNAVWTDYKYVSHDGLTDSTGLNVITAIGSPLPTAGISGMTALDLDGSGNYTVTGVQAGALDITGALTVTAWVRADSSTSGYGRVIHYHNTDGWVSVINRDKTGLGQYGLASKVGSSTTTLRGAPSGSAIPNGEWCYVSATQDALGFGQSVGLNTVSYANSIGSMGGGTNDDKIYIGDRSDLNANADISLSEIRIREEKLSSDWLAAEYANQNDPATFITSGAPT